MLNMLIVSVLILSFMIVGLASPHPSSSNITCDYVESSLFKVDMKCVAEQKMSFNNLNFTSTTAKLCTNNLQCQFDVVYWNSSQICIAITADVLKSCPLVSDGSVGSAKSRLFFTVSKSMPMVTRQALLAKGYKYKIAEILGCNLNKFLCDDLTCIDWKYRCDGVDQCQDKSDETGCPGHSKCLGRDGKYYEVGEEYAPHTESDLCKICICGADASAAYCYSPRCSSHVTNCDGPSPNICCRCADDSYLKTSTSILGYSQRLLVSCLSVLFLISLLLILSRGFTHQALRRQNNQHTAQPNWISMTSRDLPPNRSFFETNSIRPCAADFFDREADIPPPYSPTKSVENEEGNELPPSYEDSAFHPEHPPDSAVVTSPQVEGGEERRGVSTEHGPVSPISTNSDCPLLRDDRV